MGFTMNDDTWDGLYRKETNGARRREILKKALQEGLLTEREADLRTAFLDERYDQVRGQQIDYFIRGWMKLNSLRGRESKGRQRRRDEAMIREALADWQYEKALSLGETGQRIWYDELYNMSLLYMELCDSDKGYNAVLLGFGRIKDSTRAEKLAAEFRELMHVIPDQFGMEQEFAVFAKAAKAAFEDRFPEHRGSLDS